MKKLGQKSNIHYDIFLANKTRMYAYSIINIAVYYIYLMFVLFNFMDVFLFNFQNLNQFLGKFNSRECIYG